MTPAPPAVFLPTPPPPSPPLPAAAPSRRGRVRSADFGMPERQGILDLARTYLEVQAPALARPHRNGRRAGS